MARANHWRRKYAGQIKTAAESVKLIRSGDRVFIGSACGEPAHLARAMLEGCTALSDVETVHLFLAGNVPYTDPQYATNFRPNVFFLSDQVCDAVQQMRVDYTPTLLSRIPHLFRSHRIDIDVALVMVSEPDKEGHCSLGGSVDIAQAAVESAGKVIAQINRHVPRSRGNSLVHLRQFTAIVEHDEPLVTWPVAEPDEVARQIARHVSRLIPDGCTLQLSAGPMAEAVLSTLENRHDLGIHTDVLLPGMMKLAEAGHVTGRFKTCHPGQIVGSLAMGDDALSQFLNNNPRIEMHPAEYTNDPMVIAQHEQMVAINTAWKVDITGQVVFNSIERHVEEGVGGSLDFIRGSAMAKGGKPIVVLPSTLKTVEGIQSRIRASLSEGGGVGATRDDVHYVVTEYGVACLHGRSLRERALSLINIAHPDFRSELLHAAKHRRLVYGNQIMPSIRHLYPAQYETTVRAKDGEEIGVRPIKPDDEPIMKEMFYSFSEQTVYLRYHATLKSMPHNRLQVFCNVDYETEMALVALVGPIGEEKVVAVGRYMIDASTHSAELAFVVRDDYQRQGIGTYLFMRLVQIAREKGIRRFHADVLAENSGMLKIFHRSGMKVDPKTEEGVVHVTMTPAEVGHGESCPQ